MKKYLPALCSTLGMALLATLLAGCNISSDTVASQSNTRQPQQEISLSAGQTEAEVIATLGSPTGIMAVQDRTALVYGSKMLEFKNGKLLSSETNILAQINRQEEASLSHGVEDSIGPKMKKTGKWFKEQMASLSKVRDSLLK